MYFNIGKYSREGNNGYQGGDNSVTFIRKGKVISVDDPNDAGRIRVRLMGTDNSTVDSEVHYAFPMLPKHLNVILQSSSLPSSFISLKGCMLCPYTRYSYS